MKEIEQIPPDLLDIVLKFMEEAECVVNMNGTEKHRYVMNSIKKRMGYTTYNIYKSVIDQYIKIIIDISRGNKTLHLNNIKKKFKLFCC